MIIIPAIIKMLLKMMKIIYMKMNLVSIIMIILPVTIKILLKLMKIK